MKNRVTLNGGGKRQVKNFTRQEFWKCIGCILSAVTYGKKGHKLWSEVSKGVGKYYNMKLRRDVCGTTYLHKVCCAHYCYLFFLCFWYRTQPSSFHGCFFEYLPIFLHLHVCDTSWQGLSSSGHFGHVTFLIRWKKLPITSGKPVGWLTGLTSSAGKLLQGEKNRRWVNECHTILYHP